MQDVARGVVPRRVRGAAERRPAAATGSGSGGLGFGIGALLNHPVDISPRRAIFNQMVQDRSPTLDRVFHALAHPARRSMLRQLSDRGERNLSELSAPLRMSFPAASKHVKVLEKARLVRRRVVGRTHLCRLHADPLGDVSHWLDGYREHWESAFERLDGVLEELKAQRKGAGGASADKPGP
jgi:DNA-binding transcriptional ArsR family regulator